MVIGMQTIIRNTLSLIIEPLICAKCERMDAAQIPILVKELD